MPRAGALPQSANMAAAGRISKCSNPAEMAAPAMDKDDAALRGVPETIRGIYTVEAHARKDKLGADARAELRQQQAVPILERLAAEIIAARQRRGQGMRPRLCQLGAAEPLPRTRPG